MDRSPRVRSLWFVCLFVFLLAASPTFAQGLIGAAQDDEVRIIAVDPVTGSIVPLVETGATSLVGGISAFDPAGRRFFFMSGPSLYTVRLSTGDVSAVDLGGAFPLLQFDAAGGTLYGAALHLGQISIFSIDPATGEMVPLVGTEATSITGGVSAFDPHGKRFFFLEGSSRLFTVDLINQTVSNAALSATPLLQFDTSTGTLYGAALHLGQVSIFSVDPATGAMVPLVATGSTSIVEGISAFDVRGRRFFFMGGTDLYTVNLASGAVTSVGLGGVFPLLHYENAMHAIPALSPSMMAVLAALLAVGGYMLTRRAA